MAYEGKDDIFAANKDQMRITHTRRSSFEVNSKTYTINNIFTVLASVKSLLSIRQICKDNFVLIEFESQRIRVRDRVSKVLLLEGMVRMFV